MAIPKTHFCILFLLFSLFFIFNFEPSSCTSSNGSDNELLAGERESELDEWISWHVANYKNKTALETSSGVTRGGIISSESRIDLKLRQAEISKRYVLVSQDGSGNFRTIKDAIENIPLSNKRRVIVSIKPGIYREKIVIDKRKPFVTLKADDYNNPPKITWNDSYSNTGKSTLRSATVAINSDYFVAINIIFEVEHKPGDKGSQAVALQISGTKGAFYNCTFFGYQDTLYDHKGLHYFKNCFISGDVDFVCGYGQSLYEGCVLNSVANNDGSSITAQERTAVSKTSGFSFKNCIVKGTRNSMVYLGRPWGDRSRVIFSFTYMDNIILPKGWDNWSNPKHDQRAYYGEYKCSGPGSNTSGRVPWARNLSDEEANPFIGTYFVEGDTWILDSYY